MRARRLVTGAAILGCAGASAIGAAAIANGAATASAVGTYDGTFKDLPKTEVSLKVSVKNGVAKKVRQISYVGLPSNCEISGPGTLDTSPPVELNARVDPDTRKFGATVDVSQPGATPASSTVSGRFSKNFETAKGKVSVSVHFAEGGGFPEETCKGGPTAFVVSN